MYIGNFILFNSEKMFQYSVNYSEKEEHRLQGKRSPTFQDPETNLQCLSSWPCNRKSENYTNSTSQLSTFNHCPLPHMLNIAQPSSTFFHNTSNHTRPPDPQYFCGS